MNRETSLSELKIGQCAVVTGLSAEDTMRRRLQDMGLIEGTQVECVGISPLKDPSAYLIRGAVIALRKKDASSVTVQHTAKVPCPVYEIAAYRTAAE